MHLIDCHILTLPRFPSQWVREMRNDLDAEPVNQHWLPGIEGQLGDARAAGYAAGVAPFVTSADPDDRIMPGTYAALLQALHDNPGAPFAWAGERLVDEHLEPWSIRGQVREHVWPRGYDPISHVCNGVHVHGVKLYRREVVMPLLDQMREAGRCCEFMLDLAIVKPWTVRKSAHPLAKGGIPPIHPHLHKTVQLPSPTWPVHVPMVGRLWRQHRDNGFRDFKTSDFDRMAQGLGFETMNALRDVVVRACSPTKA